MPGRRCGRVRAADRVVHHSDGESAEERGDDQRHRRADQPMLRSTTAARINEPAMAGARIADVGVSQ